MMKLHKPLAVSALALLSACGSVPPAPADQYFRLSVPAPAAVGASAVRIQVETFEAHGIQSERPLLFRMGGKSAPTQKSRYEFWAEPPAKLLRDTLLTHLRALHGAGQVWTSEARAPADFVVRGRVRSMEQVLEGNGARALLSLEFTVTDAEANVVSVTEFDEEIPAASAASADYVAALNQGLARAYAEFGRRLAQTIAVKR